MRGTRPGISGALLMAGLAGLSLVTFTPSPLQAVDQPHSKLVADDPADTTPHVLDSTEYPPIAGQSKVKVNAVLPMGDRVYVGGTFTGVRNDDEARQFSRPGLFALDAVTHEVDEMFDPVFDGAVEQLTPSPDGRAIFVGGTFMTVDGQSLPRLAKLDAATGAPLPAFRPAPSAEVKDLVLAGDDRLVLAGPFSTVAGERRGGLAVVDAHTGALSPDLDIAFSAPRQGSIPRVEAIAVTPDGNTLVAGGNFTEAGDVERWQVALVDITPGRPATLLNWRTDRFDDTVVTRKPDDVPACAGAFDAHVKDIAMSADGSYFVVVTTGGYTSRGPLCDTASRWETAARGDELQPTWANYNGGDTLTGVAITGAAVYVGGHMRWMNNFDNNGSSADAEAGRGSVEREGLAALDPESGLPLPWNPRRERGHGPEAITSAADGLWVGSDTAFIGNRDFEGTPRRGEHHSKLAFFPLAGGRTLPRFPVPHLPADLYAGGEDGVHRLAFDGARLGDPRPVVDSGVDWPDVRGAFTVGDFLYAGTSDGELLRRTVDGGRFGAAEEVDRRGMDSSHFPLEDVTGMFYDRGRLYFTLDGEEELHYRYFLPQADVDDDIIGDNQPFLTAAGDIDWSDVAGMTYADGHVYWSEDGDLYRVPFTGGAVLGAPTLIAADAGLDARALFLIAPTTAPLPPSTTTTSPPANPTPPEPDPGGTTSRSGYWMVGADGRVYPFGDARHLGAATSLLGGAAAVDIEPTPSHEGYWIVDTGGRVHPFGDAVSLGGVETRILGPGETVTSVSATPSGHGYWLFTNRGRVLPFGDAGRYGDLSAVALNGPVLDSVATPSGRGYYMVASDGGIFAFGDAVFHGSMGDHRLNAPVQSLVPDGDGNGYWLVASDGGVFSFDAPFRGSMGDTPLNRPVTGMVSFGAGYLMVGADGGIFNFSDRAYLGSLGAQPPARPVVAVAVLAD